MNARIIINVELIGNVALEDVLEMLVADLNAQTGDHGLFLAPAAVGRVTGTIQQCGKAGERLGRLVVSA